MTVDLSKLSELNSETELVAELETTRQRLFREKLSPERRALEEKRLDELTRLQMQVEESRRPPPRAPVSDAGKLSPAAAAERAAAIRANPKFFKRPPNDPVAIREYEALVAEHNELMDRAANES